MASRRALVRLLAVVLVLAGPLPGHASAAQPRCGHPVLVLSAMPLELNPLVLQASLDPTRTVHVDGRTFYAGRLAGADVVLALTGIGPVNATRTATTAMTRLGCRFAAVLFSGVAGSTAFIGDVVVPARWTGDGGRSFTGVDPRLLALAHGLRVPLARALPAGDPACLCAGVDAPTPVQLPQEPQLRVGGTGETTDPFGGAAAPCAYGGGDIAGCEPCVLQGDPARDTAELPASGLPALLVGAIASGAPAASSAVAQDEETAAVAVVARQHRLPFLGIRAVSDGQGDPLHLPGFPAQFAVYRQLAGDNAAAVTVALLRAWSRR